SAGYKYEGVKFERGNCGVSIMRSGEAMEQGLRDCCRSIRIGKILIQSDEETQKAKVYYAKFPPDVYRRKVLLMYPILSTGNTVIEAVRVLIEHGVQPRHIILLSLFSTPHGKPPPPASSLQLQLITHFTFVYPPDHTVKSPISSPLLFLLYRCLPTMRCCSAVQPAMVLNE
ncbi:Uracil phosphoribosyltransferase-like protein, partial [Nibea albiflora]